MAAGDGSSSLTCHTPVGEITLHAVDGMLVSVDFGRVPDQTPEDPLLAEAAAQLDAYFDGRLRDFDLPLAPAASRFQARMRDAMVAIPYGTTRTYGEIATDLGSAARAVGGACGRNPFAIIVPCHRVVGAGGKPVGYSGGEGAQTKLRLLDLERAGARDTVL